MSVTIPAEELAGISLAITVTPVVTPILWEPVRFSTNVDTPDIEIISFLFQECDVEIYPDISLSLFQTKTTSWLVSTTVAISTIDFPLTFSIWASTPTP